MIYDLVFVNEKILAVKRVFNSRILHLVPFLSSFARNTNVTHLHFHFKVRNSATGEFWSATKVVLFVEVVFIKCPVVFKRPGQLGAIVILIEIRMIMEMLLFTGEMRMLESFILDESEGVGLMEGVVLNAQH